MDKILPSSMKSDAAETITDTVYSEFTVLKVSEENHPFNCENYNKKGLYKISIHHGHNRVYYDDEVFEFKEYAILFSRPNIVYKFEPLGAQYSAHLCVFPSEFFDQFIDIINYPVFDPQVSPLMEITKEQMESFKNIFMQMEEEAALNFNFKNDLLRTKVLQMIFDALKVRPVSDFTYKDSNSSLRLSSNFKEMLESQFPIKDPLEKILLRHPLEYANSLSVHVNHLNRSLKKVTGKTTTQLISDRLMKEAKILLQDTEWNINEISWCLGFEDRTHFIKFFKKNLKSTPSSYRKLLYV